MRQHILVSLSFETTESAFQLCRIWALIYKEHWLDKASNLVWDTTSVHYQSRPYLITGAVKSCTLLILWSGAHATTKQKCYQRLLPATANASGGDKKLGSSWREKVVSYVSVWPKQQREGKNEMPDKGCGPEETLKRSTSVQLKEINLLAAKSEASEATWWISIACTSTYRYVKQGECTIGALVLRAHAAFGCTHTVNSPQLLLLFILPLKHWKTAKYSGSIRIIGLIASA